MFLLACWLLAVTCLSVPGRGGPLELGGLDWIAVAKIACRGGALVLLGLLLLRVHFQPTAALVLPRLIPFGMFSLWAAISFLWSPLKAVTIGHAMELVTLVLAAICAGILTDSEEKQKRLFFHLFLALFLTTLAVLVLEFPAISQGERPSGYMHANALGAISATGLLLLLASRFFWNWPWTRALLLPGCAVCAFGVYAARSRTTLGATVVILAWLLWSARRRPMLLVLLILAGVLIGLVPYARTLSNVPGAVEHYVMRGQTKEDLAAGSGRDELWAQALGAFRESPLIGHGYYMLSRTGSLFVWQKQQYQTAHNLALHVLTGTGIVGTILFAWGMLTALAPAFTCGRHGPRHYPLEFLMLLFAGWYALVGGFELSILGPMDPTGVLFFTVLGLTCAPRMEGASCAS